MNKKLLVEVFIFAIALGFVIEREPEFKIGIVILFFSFGLIILRLLDWLICRAAPEDFEDKYDFKSAYEDQVNEIKESGLEETGKVKIINFERYKRWQ